MTQRKGTNFSVRRSLVAILLLGFETGCAPLPELDACGPCESVCPGDLECRNKICVDPDDIDGCSAEPGAGGADGSDGESSTDASTTSSLAGAGGADGTTDTSSSTTNGVTDPVCDPAPLGCVPELSGSSVLEVCSNRPLSLQLEAHCRCDGPSQKREMIWDPISSVPGLSLSQSGELSGTLAPGRHTFFTPVHLKGVTSIFAELEVTLEAQNCLVTFLSEDESAGVPRVAAVDIDTQEVDGWMPADTDVAVDHYAISPDGHYLAAEVDAGARLELFTLAQAGVPSLDFEHEGTLEEYAFSPDSRWLALITTNPEDETTHLQHLVSLEGESWQSVDTDDVPWVAGLSWYAEDDLVFLGVSLGHAPDLAPLARRAQGDGFSNLVDYFGARFDPNDAFFGFLTNSEGFVSLARFVSGYVDAADEKFNVFTKSVANGVEGLTISPGMAYRATSQTLELIIRQMASSDAAPAYASSPGCTTVRAWSQDDSTLLCSSASGFSVLEGLGSDDWRETELDEDAYEQARSRATLSTKGNWLAFLPTNAGLHVVPKRAYNEPLADEPLLETSTTDRDFFFTPDERHFVVQRGDELWIAALNEEASTELQQLDIAMGAAPVCTTYWNAQTAASWCGAPIVAGNAVVASSGRHMALRDGERQVNLIEFDTLNSATVGTLSDACVEGCIQFQ